MDRLRQGQHAPGDAPRQPDHHQPHHRAAEAQGHIAVTVAAHAALNGGDQVTNPTHRVRPALRIADNKIKEPGNAPGQQRHSALLAAASQWLSIMGRCAKCRCR